MRSLDEIWAEIKSYKQKPGQTMTRHMMDLGTLYTELITLKYLNREAKQHDMWLHFLANCTTADLRDKLRTRKLYAPLHLHMAINIAQAHYNDHQLKPWAMRFVLAEGEQKHSGKGKGNTKGATPVNNVQKFTGKCHTCHKTGHKSYDCLEADSLTTVRTNNSGNRQQTSAAQGTARGGSRPPP